MDDTDANKRRSNQESSDTEPSTSNTSRREFLKWSSLAMVGTGVGAADSTPYADEGARAAASFESPASPQTAESITIENHEMRLVLGTDGAAQSLVHKPTGQECLVEATGEPAFSMTLDRRISVSYPVEARRRLHATSIRRQDDQLVVGFEHEDEEITIGLTITNAYIGFSIEEADEDIEEVFLLRLPVRDRENFGEWLNVMWDDQIAVNLLGTDRHADIDADERKDYHILWARAASDVQLEGTGAALITTRIDQFLDRVARVEEDFDLPRGVESRRREEYGLSYYWGGNVNPENVDRHIDYAQQAGFQMLMMSYWSFADTPGHFPWLPTYPNELEDLKAVVDEIKAAGLTPGLHLHYNKAGKADPYVTGTPDYRLNLRRIFTLAEPLEEESDTVTVEENPRRATLDDERRILKIGDELVTYEGYTTSRPYRFTGCTRGHLESQPAAHEEGLKMGVLDVDSWIRFVRFDQRTSLPDEVAKRIVDLYHEAGFQFVYYDGAEDVHPPYWFHTSESQRRVHRLLNPTPLFAEGALAAHFNWHFMTRGNAFDLQGSTPEELKEDTRDGPAAEAPRIAKDFSIGNFGWLGYDPPSGETVGTQPDHIEYATSRAAAWDSPTAVWTTLEPLDEHPRTADNLEILRRWEEVRTSGWLSDAQKESLRNLQQEHILLIDESGDFELAPYERIEGAGGNSRGIRAFVFERAGNAHVVYWHTSGQGKLSVPLAHGDLTLFDEFGGAETSIQGSGSTVELPAGARRYLRCPGVSRREVVEAFQAATP